VTLVDTGADTMTGGRLKRVVPYLPPGEPFFLTYGDGLSDVDFGSLLAFHRSHGKAATLTSIAPPGRYGALELAGDRVAGFLEKPPGGKSFINGGFFIFDTKMITRIEGDTTALEAGPLESLAREGELMAFRHSGFWYAMDTLRDKNHLESLWETGRAPWKIW
jgi:glucose-1-phosphate cytidylyltransferase